MAERIKKNFTFSQNCEKTKMDIIKNCTACKQCNSKVCSLSGALFWELDEDEFENEYSLDNLIKKLI